MRLSPLELRKHQFAKRFRFSGYDPDEVNGFMRQMADQWAELLEDNRRLEERNKELAGRLTHYEKVELALQEALETARHTARQIEDNSEKKAKLTVEEAELRAQRMLQDAEQERYAVKRDLINLNSRQSEIAARMRAFLMAEMEVLAQYQGDDPIGFIRLVSAQDSGAAGMLPEPVAQLAGPDEDVPTEAPSSAVKEDDVADGESPVSMEEPEQPAESAAASAESQATQEPVSALDPPAAEDPMVAIEPPAVEEPTATIEPPAAEEPVSTLESPAIEEPVSTLESPAIEEPAATIEPPAVEEPAATIEPPAVEEPAVTIEPPAVEEPAVTIEPPAVEEPAATIEPPTIEEPVSAVEPPAVEELAAAIETPPPPAEPGVSEPGIASETAEVSGSEPAGAPPPAVIPPPLPVKEAPPPIPEPVSPLEPPVPVQPPVEEATILAPKMEPTGLPSVEELVAQTPPPPPPAPAETPQEAEEISFRPTYRDMLSGTQSGNPPTEAKSDPLSSSFFELPSSGEEKPAEADSPGPVPGSDSAQKWSLRSLVTGDGDTEQTPSSPSDAERERIRRILEDLD